MVYPFRITPYTTFLPAPAPRQCGEFSVHDNAKRKKRKKKSLNRRIQNRQMETDKAAEHAAECQTLGEAAVEHAGLRPLASFSGFHPWTTG